LYDDLREKKIIQNEIFHGINFDLLNVKKTYDILKKDLSTKMNFFIKKYP